MFHTQVARHYKFVNSLFTMVHYGLLWFTMVHYSAQRLPGKVVVAVLAAY